MDDVPGTQGLSYLEVQNTNRTLCTGAADSLVRKYIRTWNTNSLTVRWMMFQVRKDYRTWKSGTPTERSGPEFFVP